MTVTRDIVNLSTVPGPRTQQEFEDRVNVGERVRYLRETRMSISEAARWDGKRIQEFIWSITDDDVDVLNAIPNEDVQGIFDECVMNLEYVEYLINNLAA